MKIHLTLGPLATALVLASCGSSQGSAGGQQKESGGMSGMDYDQMGHGSMASGMLVENGKYSDERFVDAMVPH